MSVDDFEKYFPEIFEQKAGCIRNVEIDLELRENAQPKHFAPRTIPCALKEKVDKELENLTNQDIIERHKNYDWGSNSFNRKNRRL